MAAVLLPVNLAYLREVGVSECQIGEQNMGEGARSTEKIVEPYI